jgi:hypothetical protein
MAHRIDMRQQFSLRVRHDIGFSVIAQAQTNNYQM